MKTIEERALEHYPLKTKMYNEERREGYKQGAEDQDIIYKSILQEVLNLYHSNPTKDQIEIMYHRIKKLL